MRLLINTDWEGKMSLAFGIILIIAVVLYFFYVKVVKASNMVHEALSGIDVQLEKRHSVMPNLLTMAQKFMVHEKEIFTEITKLRTEAMNATSGSAEKFKAENALDDKLKSLLISVENYPQLKSNDTMVEAMKAYQDVEDNIAAARRFYNTSLRQLHDATMIFPGSLFAGFAGDALKYAFFEAPESHKAPVNATDYFK